MMKKVLLKSAVVMMLLATVCVTFAGCGNKKNNESGDNRKLVVTKHSDMGNYDQKIEVQFENGKASKFIMTVECYDAGVANSMKDLLKMSDKLTDSNVIVEGTKVKVELSPKDYFEEEGLEYNDERLARDNIKKIFESNGYTVTEE